MQDIQRVQKSDATLEKDRRDEVKQNIRQGTVAAKRAMDTNRHALRHHAGRNPMLLFLQRLCGEGSDHYGKNSKPDDTA